MLYLPALCYVCTRFRGTKVPVYDHDRRARLQTHYARENETERGKKSTRQKKTSVFDPQRSCTRRPQVAVFRLSRRSRPRKGFSQPPLDYLHTANSCCCSYASCKRQGQRTNKTQKRRESAITTSLPALYPTVTYSSDHTLITRGPSRHVPFTRRSSDVARQRRKGVWSDGQLHLVAPTQNSSGVLHQPRRLEEMWNNRQTWSLSFSVLCIFFWLYEILPFKYT